MEKTRYKTCIYSILLFVGSYGENTTIFACISHLSLWNELPPNSNDLNILFPWVSPAELGCLWLRSSRDYSQLLAGAVGSSKGSAWGEGLLLSSGRVLASIKLSHEVSMGLPPSLTVDVPQGSEGQRPQWKPQPLLTTYFQKRHPTTSTVFCSLEANL